jgi:hypothetical protein
LASGRPKRRAEQAAALLRPLEQAAGPHVLLGQTEWGQAVRLPLEFLVQAHGILDRRERLGQDEAAYC